jgi:hypothetical protein
MGGTCSTQGEIKKACHIFVGKPECQNLGALTFDISILLKRMKNK